MFKIKNYLPLIIAVLIYSCNNNEVKEVNSTDSLQTTKFEDPPEWSKKAIWYQIFVERFRNGDTSNDPTPDDIDGAYPGFVPKDWKVTPWTQDWYKEDTYFASLKGKKDFNGNPITHFGQKSQLRRYGGDLQGVLDKINYLDSLGITAIYFNPLNDAPSLHKYDARYWRHIDRNFGPNPKKDVQTMENEVNDDPATWQFTEADKMFLEVVKECHKHDIKVILDYSWNHTGRSFWAWKDLVKNQEKSKYADWYWVKKFDDPKTEENEFEYSGWMGVPDLPEIRETEYIDHSNGIVPAEGNIYKKEVKDLIFEITKRWLDPNKDGDPSDGIDGYRLDVAAEVPFGFWREFRKVVRDINPDAYLLGEVWWEKWPDELLDPKPFVEGDIFDAPMNYRWYKAARHFFNSSPDELSVSAFVSKLDSLRSNLRVQTNYAMMNLNASHDAPRVLTSLFNKNKYKFHTQPSEGNDYKIHKPDEATYETLKLLLMHQYTYIGAPHIWAGDEMGMWAADDPSTRKPLIWTDYEFEAESTHPLNQKRPVDEVKFDNELFNFYQKLIKIRKENEVLNSGDIEFIISDDENKILTYSRYDDKKELISIFNTSDKEQQIKVKTKFAGVYSNAFNNEKLKVQNNTITVTVQARKALIISSK